MKILIIGSKGFIGSHCLRHFATNHDVWECDVVTDYVSNNYFLIDATNANYDEIFKNNSFDFCINCSGAASVPDSFENPQRDFNLNVFNVFKQLDAIRKYSRDCKYINLSSAAVYGNPKYLPIDEMHPVNPISPYGRHKAIAESICEEYYELFGVKSCSLRVFSAFGEGLRKQLFWDLNIKAQLSGRVKLYGTGNESRDFIHVQDLVKAIDVVLNKCEFNASVINVAQGVEVLIRDAVTTFYSNYIDQISVEFGGEERMGDPVNWVADIGLLRSMGYSPSSTLQEGLFKYKKWLEENE